MTKLAEDIIKLLDDAGCTIRPYEGEVSACVIEKKGTHIEVDCIYDIKRHGSYSGEADNA